ncbi:MAG: MFS transporter, partial [Haloarculaceae archaeon]
MALTIALYATLQETINARLGQGSTLFGLQFSAVVVANVLLQVPVGRWSDRYGRRPFLLAGFVILIPSVFAQGVVTDPLLMLGARFLQGVAVACVFAPSLALAGDLAREGQSGTQLSILTMAFGLGVAFGPLVSGFLVSFGFLVPFAFGAGLAVLALVLVFSQVEETIGTAEPPAADPAPQD